MNKGRIDNYVSYTNFDKIELLSKSQGNHYNAQFSRKSRQYTEHSMVH